MFLALSIWKWLKRLGKLLIFQAQNVDFVDDFLCNGVEFRQGTEDAGDIVVLNRFHQKAASWDLSSQFSPLVLSVELLRSDWELIT